MAEVPHVTVDGVPVETFIEQEKAKEIEQVRREVIAEVSHRRSVVTGGPPLVSRRREDWSKKDREKFAKTLSWIIAMHPEGITLLDLRAKAKLPVNEGTFLRYTRQIPKVFHFRTRYQGPILLSFKRPEGVVPYGDRPRKNRRIVKPPEPIVVVPPQPQQVVLPGTLRGEMIAMANAQAKAFRRMAKEWKRFAGKLGGGL